MKLTLVKLQAIDRDFGESNVRWIEMTVDNVCNNCIGVSIQFWTDVKLYGLEEACKLLRNYCERSADVPRFYPSSTWDFDIKLIEDKCPQLQQQFARIMGA